MTITPQDTLLMRLPGNEGKMPWELRNYKYYDEIESPEEWEQYVKEADADLDGGAFLGRMLTWQPGKPAHDVARITALRRRLARELKADTMVEQMLVDLLTANYAQQLEWFDLLGNRTEILVRRWGKGEGRKANAVEKYDFEQLADRVVPVLDRLNRQLVRTLKAYRDLKASPIVLNIRQAGQVNVGEQQVNMATQLDLPSEHRRATLGSTQ